MAVALGMTTISLAWLVEPLVRSSHHLIYFWEGRTSILFGSVALAILVVWPVLTLLLWLTERARGRGRVALWAGILLFVPWIAMRNVHLIWPYSLPTWMHLPPYYVAAMAWVLAVALWRPAIADRYEIVIDFVSTVLAFVAISGAFFLIQLLWFWHGAEGLNAEHFLHHATELTADNHQKPRIIWIVLDELSYDQVYEYRYPGLQLPAFDKLAADSTVFTHVVPAGSETAKVLPSLDTGIPVDDYRSSSNGRLSIHDSHTGAWQEFDPHSTVFQDALDAGYGTAIAGWYNPSCRIMAAVLDRCYWSYGYILENGLASDGTIRSNLLDAGSTLVGRGRLHRLLWKVLRLPAIVSHEQRDHIVDYRNITSAADHLLADRSIGFALFHLPIPHPEGIYDRKAGELSAGFSTYIDNLALSDKYLAHVRAVLEQTGQWDSTTLVVMGDHSWRTYMWRARGGWTEEEERASEGGKFDDRPGYIVKLAGQEKGDRIDLPFQAVKTRALMDALMSGNIHSPEDLQAWVRQSVQTR